MHNFYNSLSEKERRRYAAIDALKLRYGGITYTCSILKCDPATIARGIEEFNKPLPEKKQGIQKLGVIICNLLARHKVSGVVKSSFFKHNHSRKPVMQTQACITLLPLPLRRTRPLLT